MDLARMVLSTDDEHLLRRVREVFSKVEVDLWDELSDQQQEVINASIAQTDAGQLVSHAEAIGKYRQWL